MIFWIYIVSAIISGLGMIISSYGSQRDVTSGGFGMMLVIALVPVVNSYFALVTIAILITMVYVKLSGKSD